MDIVEHFDTKGGSTRAMSTSFEDYMKNFWLLFARNRTQKRKATREYETVQPIKTDPLRFSANEQIMNVLDRRRLAKEAALYFYRSREGKYNDSKGLIRLKDEITWL